LFQAITTTEPSASEDAWAEECATGNQKNRKRLPRKICLAEEAL